MSRREGKCYVWTKADAVSVRRHTQLSCRKDNRLLGQHYTKLSDSGDPQKQEGAAEVGTQIQVILLPSPSLSFTLSTLGAKLEESRMPTASNTREWWQALCLPQWYTYNVVYSYNVHTTQKQAALALTERNSFNQYLLSGLKWKNFLIFHPMIKVIRASYDHFHSAKIYLMIYQKVKRILTDQWHF